MRYLNKIIFINSAHIKYAEVKLDGNVHFIGTQGVGKSTLLRAILFFYNADKAHLGIQREQQPFDAFYLPKQDSYTIYEVQRENGLFFVVAFLSQGRAAFRFVDCAYDRRYFVGDGGEVHYEWGRISQLIGNHYKSNIVRSYQAYLDIIYGNRQNVEQPLRRFSLMESAKYQNVPRTIQNIFLNQSLESRVIKDTIISSMDFAGEGIDLNFYREHVKDFRLQYDDIWKWYRKERDGRVKVRVDADAVLARYGQYVGACQQIEELSAWLVFALDRDRKRLPELQRQLDAAETELARQRRLLSEEEKKHQDEYGKLRAEEGGLQQRLGSIKQKRQHYEAMGIADIVRRTGEEQLLQVRRQSLNAQIETLTDKGADVRRKYEALLKVEDDSAHTAGQEANNARRQCEVGMRERLNAIDANRLERRSQAQDDYNRRREDVQEKLQICLQEKAELQKRETKLRVMNPLEAEMDETAKRMEELKEKQTQLSLQRKDTEAAMAHITLETEALHKQLLQEAELERMGLKNQLNALKTEMASLGELLSRQKGSLMEWLEGNVKGWEQTIGKVADEQHILYNTALSPSLVGKADTVFGIKIRLDDIDRSVRTPNEIAKEKGEKEAKAKHIEGQMAQLAVKAEEEFDRQSSKAKEELRQLRKSLMDTDVRLRQLPQQLEAQQKAMAALQERLNQWRVEELSNVKRALADVESRREQACQEQTMIVQQQEKALNALEKEASRDKKLAQEELKTRLAQIETSLEGRLSKIETNKKTIVAQMDAELHGAGIDVAQVQRLRAELSAVEAELRFIEQHREDYYAWIKDKKELFDHEQEWTAQRKAIGLRIADLQQKFDERRSRLTKAITLLFQEAEHTQATIENLRHNIEKVEAFMASSTCPAGLHGTTGKETAKPLGELLETLKQQIYSKQQQLEKFKAAVTTFKNNFSAQNTFHFRTEFNTEADYMDFAMELNEFVANQKIEEYRVRTSDVYADIIRRISKEMGDLMGNRGDIERTIADVNKDFKANNFTGVIKDIELRAVQSNDRLTQHLLSIKQFCDDNPMNLGEMNLFSDEHSREAANHKAVNLLMTLMDMLDAERKRDRLTLADTFKLEFKVRENDNDTGWVEKLSNVGSDGTDILVKAMVNIMLINVFKRKVSKKFGDFRLHCMMDEIGKLHPNNVRGILDFASARNIYLVNSSPTTYTAEAYRYTYLLSKDAHSNTVVKTLLTIH